MRLMLMMPVLLLTLASSLQAQEKVSPGYTIPLIDLAGQKDRQVIVDREKGQYLGHPSTVLLEDGKTMIPLQAFGLQAMSIGFLIDPDTPMVWRGLMATQALTRRSMKRWMAPTNDPRRPSRSSLARLALTSDFSPSSRASGPTKACV